MGWVLIASYGTAAYFGFLWDKTLNAPPPHGMVLYAHHVEGHEAQEELGRRAYQRIKKAPGAYDIEYGFTNFNDDSLSVKFSLEGGLLEKSEREFGYIRKELEALSAEEQKSYLASKSFRILPGNLVAVDIPALVRKNVKGVRPLAEEFGRVQREKRYDSEDLIGAVTAMVQTALFYRIPPAIEGARRTGGVLTPLKALALGWGDCDSKAVLMASVLMSWDRIQAVGVGLSGHYLMGIHRIPGRGDVFVEYGGRQYVLIEPSGPAWMLPGTVSRETLDLLQAQEDVEIDSFN